VSAGKKPLAAAVGARAAKSGKDRHRAVRERRTGRRRVQMRSEGNGNLIENEKDALVGGIGF